MLAMGPFHLLSTLGYIACFSIFSQQLWTLLLRATIKTLPDRLVVRPKKLRPQNAKNIMTSKAITTYNQWQLRPLVCTASPLPLF